MDEHDVAGTIERIVSSARFQRYRTGAPTELDAVARYLWNIQLAESLIPSVAVLEIVLRNAVHRVLTDHAGTEFWFESILHQQTYDNIVQLIGTLTRRSGHPPGVDKIISEITFGFWAKIFARRYNSLWWDQPPTLLAAVIPYHPNVARDTRTKVEARLEYFVALRNRMMHQEAIFQGVSALNRPVLPVAELHQQLLETIGWIDSDALKLVQCLDRFDQVHDQEGYQAVKSSVGRAFATP